MSASNIEIPASSDNTDLTKLSNEELLAVVANLRQENKTLLKARNKVGLTFKRIPENGNEAIAKLESGHFPYLTKIDGLSVVKKEKTDGNIALIEGENLAVLAALQMTHKGKVDVIYIDPPYNTGNDDFIYEDKRVYKSDAEDLENLELTLDGKARTVGKDDPYRHSKWLSFMERRLFLAKELLSETGYIAISIDDNEQASLKLLVDSVFGSNNFVANLAVSNLPSGRSLAKFFANNHEYVLVYAKNINSTSLTPLLTSLVKTDDYKLNDAQGYYRLIPLVNSHKEFGPHNRPNLHYPLYVSSEDMSVHTENISGNLVEVIPLFSNGNQAIWTWGKPKADSEKELLVGKFNKANNKFTIFRKDYLTENNTSRLKTFLDHKVMGLTSQSGKMLEAITGEKSFYGVKPLEYISTLLSCTSQKNPIILDFFAGSGTTGHAVAELNKNDGGNRSAILVTNNEAGIAHNVTRERIARVLTGKNWADGKEHESLPGNLSYYRLDFAELSSNPLTAAQSMEGNFDSLLSLENNALHLVEENADGDYAIYRNSDTVVFVWKNLFSLYDGEFEDLLEALKSKEQAKSYIAYVPSDSLEEDISVEGWAIESFPHGYVERYKGMIDTMRRNQTLPNTK